MKISREEFEGALKAESDLEIPLVQRVREFLTHNRDFAYTLGDIVIEIEMKLRMKNIPNYNVNDYDTVIKRLEKEKIVIRVRYKNDIYYAI